MPRQRTAPIRRRQPRPNLVGHRFGRWTVIAVGRIDDKQGRYWVCRCDCGTVKETSQKCLRRGESTSCGCYRYERQTKPKDDLAGRTFGRLIVVSMGQKAGDGERRWICRCECGTQLEIRRSALIKGCTRSCGCLNRERIRRPKRCLVGRKLGRWTVIARCDRTFTWICRCDCGNEARATTYRLTSGDSRSCGCLRNEASVARFTKHGAARTPEYKIWQGIKQRCSATRGLLYQHYAARGITVCPRWQDSFENFMADMGPRPSPLHSVERERNDLGYGPENCRWATKKEQARNTRSNRFIEHDGQRKTLAEWSEITGIKGQTITGRLANGWSPEEALTTPTKGKRACPTPIPPR